MECDWGNELIWINILEQRDRKSQPSLTKKSLGGAKYDSIFPEGENFEFFLMKIRNQSIVITPTQRNW